MKVTELMIGDWVLINNTSHQIQAIDSIDAEIQADDEAHYVGEDRYHSEDKLEGVPLTYEIFKKNGWKYNCGFFMKKVNENTHLSWTDRYGAALYKNNYHMCDCNYVHTLQHALRLCELDELADNFKL